MSRIDYVTGAQAPGTLKERMPTAAEALERMPPSRAQLEITDQPVWVNESGAEQHADPIRVRLLA